MLFNSPAFLFVFLPLAYLGWWLSGRYLGQKSVLLWLTLVSCFFYAIGEASDVVLIAASILFNYLVGHALTQSRESIRGYLLFIGVAGDLALLGYFKYFGFFSAIFSNITGLNFAIAPVELPVGISFFTFTQIAYLVDARRGLAKDRNPVSYALFVTFFPHLIAGPILHHKEMMPQFKRTDHSLMLSDAVVGLSILTLGLAKKVLLADKIALVSSPIFDAVAKGAQPTALEAWVAALGYALQIYFDFSGYSDMAIGIARIFGIKLPINFDSPYKAVSITDFWRRWHITLSRFLRDYLYIALGGNRKGELRRSVNLMMTMVLGGLWHGAGWTFLLWGSLHGLLLGLHRLWSNVSEQFHLPRLPPVFSCALTFLVVVCAWVPFRAADLTTTWALWLGMAGVNGLAPVTEIQGLAYWLGHSHGLLTIRGWRVLEWLPVLLLVWVFPNTQEIFRNWNPGLISPGYRPLAAHAGPAAGMIWSPTLRHAAGFGLLFVLAILNMTDLAEFIYFQF